MSELGEPRRIPIGSLLDAAQHGALAFIELYPGGENVTMPRPRIVGPGHCEPITGVTRSVFVAAFTDARLYRRYDGLEVDGRMLFDYQGREIYNIVAECPRDKFACEGEDVFAFDPSAREPVLEVPEALTLVGNNSVNFGHWIFEHIL
ncbi:MAG: hypothetical protein JOZ97_07495, partial [Candidatus Eremiobacteraeota bacterium]|nr:hypothetical protein [Candidatus Eremiobacteraeota bacterium]